MSFEQERDEWVDWPDRFLQPILLVPEISSPIIPVKDHIR